MSTTSAGEEISYALSGTASNYSHGRILVNITFLIVIFSSQAIALSHNDGFVDYRHAD
jgi:hypothetical protein